MARRAGVVIDVDDVVDLARRLRAFSRADLDPLMRDVATGGRNVTRDRIEDGGPAPDGAPWAPRNPRDSNPHPLLNREGGLVDSITAESDRGSAAWGSNLVYAAIHQFGGTIVPRDASALWLPLPDYGMHASQVTISARPWLGWGEDEVRTFEDSVSDWVERHVGESAAR